MIIKSMNAKFKNILGIFSTILTFWFLFFCVNINLFPKIFKQINMILILSAVLICALLLLIKIIKKEIIDKKLFIYFVVLIIYLAYLTGHLFIFERNSYYSFTSVMFLYFIFVLVFLFLIFI